MLQADALIWATFLATFYPIGRFWGRAKKVTLKASNQLEMLHIRGKIGGTEFEADAHQHDQPVFRPKSIKFDPRAFKTSIKGRKTRPRSFQQ